MLISIFLSIQILLPMIRSWLLRFLPDPPAILSGNLSEPPGILQETLQNCCKWTGCPGYSATASKASLVFPDCLSVSTYALRADARGFDFASIVAPRPKAVHSSRPPVAQSFAEILVELVTVAPEECAGYPGKAASIGANDIRLCLNIAESDHFSLSR